MVIEKISTPEVVEVDDLDATDRGTDGFGSTGVAAIETKQEAVHKTPQKSNAGKAIDNTPKTRSDKRKR